jgi:O-antigen/teichoic acid export membrane protein
MGFFGSTLVAFTIGSRQLWRRFSFNIETQDFLELIKFGLPMMSISVLTTTMTVIDRIMIAIMLDRETLGIYSVANVGIGIMRTISTSMGQLFLVKFAEMHGQNRSLKNTASAIDKALEGLSCFIAPLVAGMVSIFPVIVWLLLPRFMEGIAAGKLLIAESFFLSLSLPTANWCVATGRYMTVIVTRGSLVIAEAVGIYLLLKNGAELKWVAGYVLSISAFFCLLMIVIVNKILRGKIVEGVARSIYVIAPFMGVFIAIAVQDLVYQQLELPEGSRLVISFILGAIASLPICLPFVLRANRILGITRLITRTSKVLF